MDVTVYRPGELTAADRAAWTALQSQARSLRARRSWRTPSSPPSSRSPSAAAAAGCGSRCSARTASPAAFFPFQRSALGIGRAIGLGVSDAQGLVHRPGFRWDAQELLRACGLAVWEFDHLVEGQSPFEAGLGSVHASPVIDVDQGYEAYLTRLRARSPKFTRTTLAKERKLGRDVGEVRYVHDERDPAALRTLMGWKSAQYRRTGRSDRFAQPWIIRLAQQLFHTRTDSVRGAAVGAVRGRAAGRRALRAAFTDRVLACWFPAYDPAVREVLARAGPASADGARRRPRTAWTIWIWGAAQKEYKDSLKTRELAVSEGWVMRRHPGGAGASGAACAGPGAAQCGAVPAGAVRAGRPAAQTGGPDPVGGMTHNRRKPRRRVFAAFKTAQRGVRRCINTGVPHVHLPVAAKGT